ncbi:hypothetical protein [Cellulomonas sp. Root137]|uniref:hypothetical protein n=1 Tax=unclassified Cellulomonas TaxID=2620175 RepID=UPI00070C6651|nr:hypothetical protein [Cellulomonas sp. Root137]KRD42997.1 hypothetical protein ASE38_01545 [Cellulomonas sp. Root930]
MATTRSTRALYLVLGLFLFAVVSQIVDLLAGASEVGVRTGVIVVAAVGAVVTGVLIARRRRIPPPVPRQITPAPEEAPEDHGPAGATSVPG